MRSFSLALASVFLLGCGSPCRDRNIAFIAAGGPLGILAAALDQCTDDSTPPQQPQPIAAVPSAGLVEQTGQPDLGSVPPDMAEPAPDLAPPSCAPGYVLTAGLGGAQYCVRDSDGDGIGDTRDKCATLAAGQNPDPDRLGCPAPKTYTITMPAAAFAAAGNLEYINGVATSRPNFDWANSKAAPATLSSVIFFRNANANANNAVTFELNGMADFTAPTTRLEPCSVFKDNRSQDAVTRPPNDIACVPRRVDLCIVDLATPYSKAAGESDCARTIGGGGGYVSKANAPIRLSARVASADFISSEPRPVDSIELQVVLSGNVSLSNWSVIATVVETLH